MIPPPNDMPPLDPTNDRVRAATGLDSATILALEPNARTATSTAFIAGSRVLGYSNVGSDIDVFVIGEGKPTGAFSDGDATRYYHSQHFHEGLRVDYEFWHPEVVHRLAVRASSVKLNTLMPIDEFTADELVLLDRIRHGVPLHNSDQFHSWQSAVDYRHLARFLTYCRIRRIDVMLEDIIGMVDSDDLECAALQGRALVEAAADAFAYSLGATSTKDKWRMKVLTGISDSRSAHVRQRLWHLSFPLLSEDAGQERCRVYVMDCIAFANQVTDWVIP